MRSCWGRIIYGPMEKTRLVLVAPDPRRGNWQSEDPFGRPTVIGHRVENRWRPDLRLQEELRRKRP